MNHGDTIYRELAATRVIDFIHYYVRGQDKLPVKMCDEAVWLAGPEPQMVKRSQIELEQVCSMLGNLMGGNKRAMIPHLKEMREVLKIRLMLTTELHPLLMGAGLPFVLFVKMALIDTLLYDFEQDELALTNKTHAFLVSAFN